MTHRLRRLAWLAATATARPLQFAVYALAGLVPRQAGLWVFGSWGGFRYADNSAAFFRYCDDLDGSSIEPVWISRERAIVERVRLEGRQAHWIWSPRGMLACARAEAYLFDNFSKDINFWLSRGSLLINLWSGVPLKAFERDIDQPSSRYFKMFHGRTWERVLYSAMMPWHAVRPHLLIATSETTAEITRRAFDVRDDDVAITGFPRNDVLLRATADSERSGCPPQLIDDIAAGRPTFMYLPTYRDSAEPYIDIDWDRLDTAMAAIDGRFYLKFHPDDRSTFGSATPRIVQLFQDTDVYEVLPHVSVLISDYSSIIFDFAVLDRPVIHYMPDLDRFIAGSRRLVFQPTEVTLGPTCLNGDELLAAIADDPTHHPSRDPQTRDKVVEMLHRHVDDHSCDRVLAAIERRRGARRTDG